LWIKAKRWQRERPGKLGSSIPSRPRIKLRPYRGGEKLGVEGAADTFWQFDLVFGAGFLGVLL
jgi:hypothetical protein